MFQKALKALKFTLSSFCCHQVVKFAFSPHDCSACTPNCSNSFLNPVSPLLLAKKLEIRREPHLPHSLPISSTAGLQAMAVVQMWGFISKSSPSHNFLLNLAI